MSQPNSGMFGIAWQLDILDANDNAILTVADDGAGRYQEVELQFNIEQTINSTENGFWVAEISLYNLNDANMLNSIVFGQQVKLQAGWKNQASGAPYGTIFEGSIYQPLWERIDGINYKLTLRCVTGLVANFNTFLALPLPAGMNQRQVVAAMAAKATGTTVVIDPSLDSLMVQQSRGEVIFGRPSDYMHDIGRELQASFWINNLVYRIQNILQEQSNVPTFQYSQTSGLIGTPQQTQDGVTMSVLLDCRLLPGYQVQLLPGTAIELAKFNFGEGYPNIVDQQGKYGILSVTHVGDSRGNTWQSDLVCLTYATTKAALLNNPNLPLLPDTNNE